MSEYREHLSVWDDIIGDTKNVPASDELRGRDYIKWSDAVMTNCTSSPRKSKPSYSELLKDPRWLSKRLEINLRANGRCERCQALRPLQVHHLRYETGKMPWETPNKYLRALCRDCHKLAHGIREPEPDFGPGPYHIRDIIPLVLDQLAAHYMRVEES